MDSIVNIAAYRFAELSHLVELRRELIALCKQQALRGTILLSAEGVNLFVAGSRLGIDSLLVRLRAVPGLEELEAKESFSDDLPFNRMLVKIKREIIAFGVDGIDPRQYTSRRVSAPELKRWLDEGRPVRLLDTRNDFEVDAGTFQNAVAIGIDDFRDFPRAVRQLPETWKHEPIVTFCTGGIRCEKAAPLLEREGFRDVYQLDGGILKYFETCGDAHYDGQCFVFDKRVALDAALREHGMRQCFVCQAILPAEEQQSPHYVEGVSCPRCYRSPADAQAKLLAERNAAIQQAVTPLPGSVPYDNIRPISVPGKLDGYELLDYLDAMKTHLARQQWIEICAAGKLICRGEVVLPGRIVRAGERLLHKMPATLEPAIATNIEILYEDLAIVVVNKPAPLPMHPCGRFNRNSLSYILDQVYHPLCLRPMHRLDADTSGVVIFGKTREVAGKFQPQFEAGNVKKTYLARVHGWPVEREFECRAAISSEPGVNGVRLPDEQGAPASTRFRVLRQFDDHTALLEVAPLTGRTNQIRIHLWQVGHAIVGDPIYLRDRQLGMAQTLSVDDPPLCLHALAIEFTHPHTKQSARFETPAPGWAE